MINRRFFNYKLYSSFLRDLNDDQISEDAIVFIQDESHPCIWTHGKEYTSNIGKTSLSEGVLTFDDGYGNTVFTLQQTDGKIIITDSKGKSFTTDYSIAIDSTLDDKSANPVENKVVTKALDLKADRSDLDAYLPKGDYNPSPVLKAGDYIEIKEDNSINWTLSMDKVLSKTSTNPVENKAIYDKLDSIQKSIPGEDDYQEPLVAGDGIDITGNKISCTLDTDVFVILTQEEFQNLENPSSDKIYIVIEPNGDDTYRFTEYVYRNGQWITLNTATAEVDLSSYYTKQESDNIYQPIGDYIDEDWIEENILPLFNDYYTKQDSDTRYQPIGTYATEDWVTRNFVKREEVYTPKQGDLGTDTEGSGSATPTPSGGGTITVDSSLNYASTNPVENRVITLALDGKVDNDTLSSYATKQYVTNTLKDADLEGYAKTGDLDAKQDTLTPGTGISIVDNVINCTLDTNVFVVVDQLPSMPDSNKIYLLSVEDNGTYTYVEYRWDGSEWHNVGQRNPDINLSGYLTRADAINTYQVKGNYALAGDLDNYITEEDYAAGNQNLLGTVNTRLQNYLSAIDAAYQKKGDYTTTSYVTAALTALQQIIDSKYVLKQDVYNPNNTTGWSTSAPTTITVEEGEGGGSASSGGYVHLFMEQDQYDNLLSYDNNTIYFIYEESESPSGSWEFGDSFPIILT